MTKPAETPATSLSYFVEGMDCANCVQQVERMVDRLPGAAQVKTSFSRQTLQLQLDETQTSRTELEKNLRSLGYAPSLRGGAAPQPAISPAAHDHAGHSHEEHSHAEHDHQGHDHGGHDHTHETLPAGTPWYASGQGSAVLISGALLLAAWLFGFVEPALARYGYVAATLFGVWPLLKKAVAAARPETWS